MPLRETKIFGKSLVVSRIPEDFIAFYFFYEGLFWFFWRPNFFIIRLQNAVLHMRWDRWDLIGSHSRPSHLSLTVVLDSIELHDAWPGMTTMEETKLFFKLNERFETFEYT